MKKLILTALLALVSLLPAQALTYDVGGEWNKDHSAGYNANDINGVVFARLNNTYSGSQVLLTADELSGITPKTTADGITRAKITSLTVKMHTVGINWAESGSLTVNAYAQNIEETAFPKINNVPQFFAYDKSDLATVSFTVNDALMMNDLYASDSPFELTLNFGPDGFVYEGKSILLTVFAENTIEDVGATGDGPLSWWDGIYAYTRSGDSSAGFTDAGTPITELSGELKNKTNAIPCLLFTYEEEVEKLGPTVTEGPADVYTTVDYDSPGTGDGSSGQILPHDPYNYTNSFCQTLYTAADLKGLNKINETGENVKAKITSLTFKMLGSDGYLCGSFSSKIYIQNVDATTFPIKNGKPQWFDNYQDGSSAQFQSQEFAYEEYFEPIEFTIILDEPIIYEGGSLLITWISEGSMSDGYRLISQVFAGDGIRSGVLSKDYTDLSNTTGDLQNKSSNLPVLKINFVPLTYGGGEAKTVVSFANVKYGVAKAADSKGAEANNVYVEFDLEDASDCGSYDIYLGTQQIGHMTGKHGFVNFLTASDKDQTISVKPNGGENVIAGTPLTITASDLNALFAAPEVTETIATMMYGKFDHNDKSVGLQGAAKVKVTAPAPVTAIKLGDNLLIMYKGTSSNGYNDAFEGLIPETATSWEVARDPALNNGEVSFYHNGTTATVNVVRHEPQINDLSGRITLKPTADYVCLTGATVTEDAAATASAATNAITVSRTSADNYYVRFNAETPIEFDVTMPTGAEKIVMEEDGEYLMFYTTQGATLQYRLEPTAAAQPGINALAEDAADSSYDNSHEWTTAEKGYINLNLQENKGNKVFVRTVDTKGNARLTAYREIKADGTTSGVAEIEADAAAGAEYFNLQGIRVSGELTPGIYIRRQGTTATKVTVK